MFTSASFHHRGYGWLPLTLGDALVLGSHQFVAMYLHELCYRAKISPIAIAHHVCTVVIAEIAVALTLMEREWKVAGTEFMLCLVWGMCFFCFLFSLFLRFFRIPSFDMLFY